MAILTSKKNTAPKAKKTAAVAVFGAAAGAGKKHVTQVLLSPRITEKAAISAEVQGGYVFNVAKSATKKDIATAVKELFKVTPRQVRVVSIPRKAVQSRRSREVGHTASGKKAYVYLKKGDKIEFA